MSLTLKDRRPRLIFVHSELDDLGLNPLEFRVYCHIARRTDSENAVAYASKETMAEICNMSESSVMRSVDWLETMGLIEVHRRNGFTNQITLTDKREWKLPPRRKDTGVPQTPPPRPTDVGTHVPQTPKGYPDKVLQEEGSPSTPKPPKGASRSKRRTREEICKSVYAIEIHAGLRNDDFQKAWKDWVLYRTGLKKPGDWETMFRKQLDELAGMGSHRAAAALNYSMMMGYQGIYERKQNGNPIPEKKPVWSGSAN